MLIGSSGTESTQKPVALLMTPPTTMTATMVEGAPTLTILTNIPPHFTPSHLKPLKVEEGNDPEGPILQNDPPSTFRCIEKHVAHPPVNDLSLSTHHECKPVDLDAICHEIKCENERFSKFMANLFPSWLQQRPCREDNNHHINNNIPNAD